MKKIILKFIKAHGNLIDNNEWEMLYVSANNVLLADDVGELTLLLLSANIDPLSYLDFIPEDYLAYAQIKEFNIPNNIKKIGAKAFSNCGEIIRIDIPDSVEEIGRLAFYNCLNLKSIKMSKNLKVLGDDAFYASEDLKDIYFDGTVAQWTNLEENRGEVDGPKYTVHCVDGTYVRKEED